MSKALKEQLIRSTLMNTREVASALGISERTIIRWRSNRINLPFSYIAGQARYEPAVVHEYKKATSIEVQSLPSVSRSHVDAA